MGTLNQLSQLDFANNLILNQLNMDDKSALVYDYSNGYNVIDFLVTRNAPARRIDGLNGIFQKPIMGVSQVIAQVASTVLVTSIKLRVNFTDTTYDLFRLRQTVSDGTANNWQGRVIEHGAGYIILEPVPPITSWNTALHFVAGTYATELFNSSENRGSIGTESLYEQPQYVQNQTSVTRESVEIFRRDMFKTWVTFKGDYWASAQDTLTMQRFARELEFKSIWSRFGTIANSPVGGTVNYSMGLKDAILDGKRGGIYRGLTSAMGQSSFEEFIGTTADRQSAAHVDLTLVVGRGALRQVQSFTSPFIQFGGKENTFGGDTVKGLDVYKYNVNGINCNLIMAPVFNDRDRFPQPTTVAGLGANTRMQYTMVALDMSNYEAVGGGSLPAMEKCYFGEQEVVYEFMRGVGIGKSFVAATAGMNAGTMGGPVTDRDSISFQAYSDCAYDFMANRMGWLEVIV